MRIQRYFFIFLNFILCTVLWSSWSFAEKKATKLRRSVLEVTANFPKGYMGDLNAFFSKKDKKFLWFRYLDTKGKSVKITYQELKKGKSVYSFFGKSVVFLKSDQKKGKMFFDLLSGGALKLTFLTLLFPNEETKTVKVFYKKMKSKKYKNSSWNIFIEVPGKQTKRKKKIFFQKIFLHISRSIEKLGVEQIDFFQKICHMEKKKKVCKEKMVYQLKDL